MKEMVSVFHQEYRIMAEYRMLQTENLQGIYVIPSNQDSLLWYGVVFVRSGLYAGGVFRFTLQLPDHFPDDKVPVLTFTSQVYHPAVDVDTGVMRITEVFPQWDIKQNHIWQILKYLHWIFYNMNMKVPANIEASNMFKTNKKAFVEKIKECVALSLEHLYDDPPTEDKHYITFEPYDSKIHNDAKNAMLRHKENDESSHGISWVQTGSCDPFSKVENTGKNELNS